MTVTARLTSHARTMEQGVYQVAEDFYVAVGYGNANMTMVTGTDGVILIDSMENAEAAREALADLRRFSDKPVKALIYTHSHPDHSSGSRGLLDPSEIYAHERLAAGMRGNPSLGIMSPLRLAYSFGWDLKRGTVRDIWQWVRAVDLLRGFGAQALIFGHGRPLTGQDEVRDLLTAYRDAMQYIHDQTVRLMARGLTPDDLVEVVAELPPRLRDHPWLGEFYGAVKQTVRQIYSNYFG